MKFLKSKKLKIFISVVFTVVLLFLLFRIIDFEFFFASLQTINYKLLIVAALSLLITHFFRTWRFRIIFNIKKNYTIFFISTTHYLFNRLLPARTGEATLPLLFKKHYNISYQKGIGALLLLRVFDLWAVFFLFFMSLLLVKNIELNYSVLMGYSILGLIILAVLWIKLELFLSLFIALLKKIKWKSLTKIINKLNGFLEQVKIYRAKRGIFFFVKLLLSSLLSWFFVYVFYFFTLKAFHLDIPFFNMLFASTISNFTFILPISAVGNLGTFEAGWALGYHLIGIDKDISVPIGFFANIYTTLITAFMSLIGYFMYMYSKKLYDK